MYFSNSPINTSLKVNVTEDLAYAESLIRVAYSIGVEASSEVVANCSPVILCGSSQETMFHALLKGVDSFKFSNNLLLDIPPTQSRLINISEQVGDGVLFVRGAASECFLWDTKGERSWLKGSIFFTVGNIPPKLNLGNPNPSNIRLSVFIAQQAEGALTLSSGSIE